MSQSHTQTCIGRFQFELDEAFSLSGRSQTIYRVKATTVALNARNTAQAVWNQRLADIRGVPPQLKVPDPVVRTFELEPGVMAIWYYERPNDRSQATLEVLKPFGDHALRLVREISAGTPAVTEQTFKRILAGYRPGSRHGFCLEHGALVTEASRYEETSISLVHPPLSKLSFMSDTVEKPDGRDPLHDVEEERQVLSGSGSEVSILVNRRRTVAQLPGVEARFRLVARGERPVVRFTWRFDGTARSASAPQMMLVGTTSPEGQAAFEPIWDHWLESIRQIPVPPQ